MTYAAPDLDDASDIERRARAELAHLRALLNALNDVPIRAGSADRRLVIQLRASDLALITPGQREQLDRVAWTHRRALPPQLRPRLPTHDPIVREMASGAEGASALLEDM